MVTVNTRRRLTANLGVDFSFLGAGQAVFFFLFFFGSDARDQGRRGGTAAGVQRSGSAESVA